MKAIQTHQSFNRSSCFLLFILWALLCLNVGCDSQKQGETVPISQTKTAETSETIIPLFGYAILPSTPIGIQNLPINNPIRSEFENANTLYSQFKYEEAMNVMQHVLDAYMKDNANDKLGVALLYERLGAMSLFLDFSKGDNKSKPRNYLDKALEIFKGLDESYVNQATCNYYLGRYLSIIQDRKQAIEYYKRSIDLFSQAKASDSRQIAQVYYSLAYQDPENSVPLLKKAMKIVEKEMGDGHPDIGKVYLLMGYSRITQNDRNGALQDYNKALAIFDEKLGKYSPESAEANSLLADFYDVNNDIPKAIASYLSAYYVFSQKPEFKLRANMSLEHLRILHSWTNNEQPFEKWLDNELKQYPK